MLDDEHLMGESDAMWCNDDHHQEQKQKQLEYGIMKRNESDWIMIIQLFFLVGEISFQ